MAQLNQGHIPVLLAEVMKNLSPSPGMTFVDATVGAGGHSAAILEKIQPGGQLVGLDRDPETLALAAERLSTYRDEVKLVHSRFDRLKEVVMGEGIQQVDGILLDLGVSSLQLDNPRRGFSFTRPGPLDMRMDQGARLSAADLVANYGEEKLVEIFYQYGEERWSRRIAKRILEERKRKPICTTDQLADIVAGAIPRGAWPKGIHPATRVFQALRIAVNEELAQVEPAIRQGVDILRSGGRIGVIAFHSLEDRIVKHAFTSLSGACTCPPGLPVCACGARALVQMVTRKPIMPSREEMERNPRSRSARLRVAEKTQN